MRDGAVGLVPLLFNVRRAQLMGFFLVPTMLFYSGRQGHIVDWLLLQQRTAPLLPSVTLSDIALAVLAAAAVALAAYHLARRIVAVVRKRDLTACEISKPGKLVGYATGGAAAVILLIALFGRAYPDDEIAADRIPDPKEWAEGRIARVIDGDTADIASGCRRFRVRFSGVDAPELGSACRRPRSRMGAIDLRESGRQLESGRRRCLRPLPGSAPTPGRHLGQPGNNSPGLRSALRRTVATGSSPVPKRG